MARRLTQVAFVCTFVAGCVGASPTLPPADAPSAPAATIAPPATAASVPAGRLLSYRIGADGMEHYFTIKTDGTDVRQLFTTDGCGCASFSPDGTRIVTMGSTGHGTWSLMTMLPDGTDRKVVDPPIETLTLAQPVANAGFEQIAFSAWDDTDPSRNGLYIAAPDLADLRQVLPLQIGSVAMEPFGVTPDGSRVLFFNETGPMGGITHAGDLYVVDASGSGLRQLNPLRTSVGFMDMPTGSLSPDGSQVAFAAGDAVFVGDVDSGTPMPITSGTGMAWAVSWSPTGEWIVFTRQHRNASVITLVRPDGSDQHQISAADPADEAIAAVWSPDGRYLLARRGSDDTHDLWIMDLEGTYVRRVTQSPGRYGNYSWALPVSA